MCGIHAPCSRLDNTAQGKERAATHRPNPTMLRALPRLHARFLPPRAPHIAMMLSKHPSLCSKRVAHVQLPFPKRPFRRFLYSLPTLHRRGLLPQYPHIRFSHILKPAQSQVPISVPNEPVSLTFTLILSSRFRFGCMLSMSASTRFLSFSQIRKSKRMYTCFFLHCFKDCSKIIYG